MKELRKDIEVFIDLFFKKENCGYSVCEMNVCLDQIIATIKPEIEEARQEGKQEVVDWLEQHGDLHFNFPFANIRREKWQDYCKEVGISKDDYRKARGCAPRPPGAPPPEEIIGKSRGG